MYILKNAYKSIVRTKMRNILIGIVICIIGIACTLGLAINSASKEIVQSKKDSSEVQVTFSIDREAMRTQMQTTGTRITMESISSDKIASYVNSTYVKELRVKTQIGLNSSNIEVVSNDNFIEKNVNTTTTTNTNRPEQMGADPRGASRTDFELVGYSDAKSMTEFVSGTYKITSGEMIDLTADTYDLVINSELAEENSLKVGSTITFTNPNKAAETYTFIVKGIYTDTTKSDDVSAMFSNSANRVIVTNKALAKVVTNSELSSTTKIVAQTTNTIILKDVNSVAAFTKEVTAKGLPTNYELVTNEEAVLAAIKPIENLTNFTNIFLILVLVIGAVILVILNMINIRERKYEIGVLRAIGMKKSKVLAQFVTELFMVTVISILIGATIGSALSVPAANYMLKSEITAAKAESSTIDTNFGKGMGMGRGPGSEFITAANTKYIEQINAAVDLKVISEILLIGLALTIVSSSISMIAISRYNPLKILSSRS